MLPAKCELLKCPYCGKEKEVLSLASGNTFRKISTFLCLRIAGYVVEKEIERLQQKT